MRAALLVAVPLVVGCGDPNIVGLTLAEVAARDDATMVINFGVPLDEFSAGFTITWANAAPDGKCEQVHSGTTKAHFGDVEGLITPGAFYPGDTTGCGWYSAVTLGPTDLSGMVDDETTVIEASDDSGTFGMSAQRLLATRALLDGSPRVVAVGSSFDLELSVPTDHFEFQTGDGLANPSMTGSISASKPGLSMPWPATAEGPVLHIEVPVGAEAATWQIDVDGFFNPGLDRCDFAGGCFLDASVHPPGDIAPVEVTVP